MIIISPKERGRRMDVAELHMIESSAWDWNNTTRETAGRQVMNTIPMETEVMNTLRLRNPNRTSNLAAVFTLLSLPFTVPAFTNNIYNLITNIECLVQTRGSKRCPSTLAFLLVCPGVVCAGVLATSLRGWVPLQPPPVIYLFTSNIPKLVYLNVLVDFAQ